MFGHDLVNSKDKNLSHEIQEKGITILKELKDIGISYGVTVFSGVATEVFRKANNGGDYLKRIKENGVNISLVSQELEGELGFNSVCVVGNVDRETGIVWDSGGASFQITSLDKETKKLKSYMGAIGSSVSTGILMREVREITVTESVPKVNPVSTEEGDLHIAALISKMSEVPTWLIGHPLVYFCAGKNSLANIRCADHANCLEPLPWPAKLIT